MTDQTQGVIEGEGVVVKSTPVSNKNNNDLPDLPESMHKTKKSKVELNELADYVAKDYDEEKPRELSKLARKKQYVEEEWPEQEEYKLTNAFGLPKKNPSQALKQEWPPKDEAQNLTDEEGNVITNAFDLPKNFSVPKPLYNPDNAQSNEEENASWYPNEPKPNYLEAQEGEKTNALGVPLHWYERKQQELALKKQQEEPLVPQLTEEEIEEIRVNAHKKGYDAGYKSGLKTGHDEGVPIGVEEGKKAGFDEGYAAGLEQAKADMQEKVQYFEQALEKLAIPLSNLDNQIADAVVNLALNLTEQLVYLGVDRSKTYITTAINEAISMLPVLEEGVTITVNQHDRDILAEAYNEEELAKRKWTIMVENTLNNGDLQVEAKDSSISVTLEQKLQDLVRAFVSANLQ